MPTTPDLRESFARIAQQVESDVPAHLQQTLKVGRRRHVVRHVTTVTAAAVIIGLSVIAISNVIRADRKLPAVPGPTVVRNGPIDLFGSGGGVRALTPDGRSGDWVVHCGGSCLSVWDADWSPDGSRLAFTASGEAADPYHGIHVLDIATGVQRQVVSGEGYHTVEWSPDGLRIAFADNGDLYVMNADGSGRALLARDADGESFSWSPDGTMIAFEGATGGREVPMRERTGVFLVRIDGSAPAFLTNGFLPAWSPDGTTIAYVFGPRHPEVRTITPDGRTTTTLATIPTFPQSCVECGTSYGSEWSPDGSQLALTLSRNVFVIDSGGGRVRSLRGKAYDSWKYWAGLAWQPIPVK